MSADGLLDHAIWWHVYPLGACGAPIREHERGEVQHRLGRLDPWLDYAIELGCSGLLLGPIFDSVAHGYDTLDHFVIDPRLGDDGDFDHLVAQCRERGLSIVLDGVFNHVVAGHRLAREAAAAGPGGGLLKRNDEGYLLGWEGNADLLELDHSDSRVEDFVVEVMLHWLRRGIAGWRLDVAYAVPADFWRRVTDRVRADFPDALFIGEMIHGEYAEYVRESGLDTVTEYELWKAIRNSIETKNFWELDWTLQRHNGFLESFVPQTFIGNHDVTRIATAVGADESVLAMAILMTVGGMPSLYYGDEQGFTGEKTESAFGDDAVRPPLPDGPAELLPSGQWLFDLHKALIGIRRRNPWLARARTTVLHKTNTEIGYETTGPDGQRVQVELQVEPEPAVRIVVGDNTEFDWVAGQR